MYAQCCHFGRAVAERCHQLLADLQLPGAGQGLPLRIRQPGVAPLQHQRRVQRLELDLHPLQSRLLPLQHAVRGHRKLAARALQCVRPGLQLHAHTVIHLLCQYAQAHLLTLHCRAQAADPGRTVVKLL